MLCAISRFFAETKAAEAVSRTRVKEEEEEEEGEEEEEEEGGRIRRPATAWPTGSSMVSTTWIATRVTIDVKDPLASNNNNNNYYNSINSLGVMPNISPTPTTRDRLNNVPP